MRIAAIDLGDARTGVAVSDLSGTLAGESFVISEWSRESLADKLCELFKSREVGEIIVGFPRNMDGSKGSRAALAEEFCGILREKSGIKTLLWDERRTTLQAADILSKNKVFGKKRKERIDALAAALILESYLEFKNRENKNKN